MRNNKPVVLVVDDDPAVRDSLKFSLELEGLTVHACSSGLSLLEHPHLRQAQCIVLDCKMPQMDGFEVLDRLEKSGVPVPVILITGPVTAAVRAKAAHPNVRGLLEKPLLDSALLDCIRDVIA